MAASTAPRPGAGATLAFTTNDYAVRIKSANWSGLSREALETTYLGSANNAKEFMPSDLYDPGTIDCDFDSNPNLLDALKTHLTAGVDTVTLTFDQETGESSATTVACSGFIIDHSLSVVTEEIVSGSFTIKLTGPYTPTDAT